MEKKSLYIKVMQDGKEVSFPTTGGEPVRINKATYTAQRMGGTPQLTADFYYPRILDNEWTHKEYVVFRGERYYVDMTPSAEKDNSTLLYKHSITFVSERIVLEHEFFYDVVTEATEAQYADRFRSNVSSFSFYGDIEEFVGRLNDSLIYTKMCEVVKNDDGTKTYNGYHVVIDEGIRSDIKEVSFENKRITEALQEINSTFELAYYFKGKEIHVGYTEHLITKPFEYGAKGGLLKVQHTNSNTAIVDRITGVGASTNLPYYYPNETAAGVALYEVKNSGIEGDDVVESISMEKLYKNIKYPIGKTLKLHSVTPSTDTALAMAVGSSNFVCSTYYDRRFPPNEDSGILLYKYDPNIIGRVWLWEDFIWSSGSEQSGTLYAFVMCDQKDSFDWENTTVFTAQKGDYVTGTAVGGGGAMAYYYDSVWYKHYTYYPNKEDVEVGIVISIYTTVTIDGKEVPKEELHWITGESNYTFERDCRFKVGVFVRFPFSYTTLHNPNVWANCPANATIEIHRTNANNSGLYFVYADGSEEISIDYEDSGITFKDSAIDVINRYVHTFHYDAQNGFVKDPVDESQPTTEICITGRRWIAPTQNLMPSIYRESLGAERYFNATNNEEDYERAFEWEKGNFQTFDYEPAYKISEASDAHYSFLNEYNEGNPHADYQKDESIKPTIEGVRNDIIEYNEDGSPVNYTEELNEHGEWIKTPAGQLYGEIADIAFDENDSDATKDVSGTEEYIHSYFYIKLHKFSGDMDFNLFDYASESDTAKVNMTSGNCAGCSFEIGVPAPTVVDEELGKYKFFNGVQVKEDGTIADGDYTGRMNESETEIAEGDFGNKVKLGHYQECQQDTSKYSVWIALKKENSTFGVVMPNHSQNYRPQVGDKFTITGINAPLKYITAAEKRLDKALVKYMAENNVEKFNFSITFSRIWLTEHPEIASELNENARLFVNYNNEDILLYVTNYSVKMDDNILEEITVELKPEIADSASATLTAKLNSMKEDILGEVANQDYAGVLSVMRQHFLSRKASAPSEDRTALGKVYLQGGVEAAGVKADSVDVTNNLSVGGDAAIDGKATTSGGLEVGEFSETGTQIYGMQVDEDGNVVARSLRLGEFLEVPEIRYNKVSVYTGIQWNTFGGGIIESVEIDYDENGVEATTGTITLKLEEGEIGAIEDDDLCQGIWHNFHGYNEAENADEHNGNFKFAGFSTVYFRISKILEEGTKAKFKYVLRGDWSIIHPQAGMHFACYANPNNKDRQSCRYSTTEYEISLQNMTDWTYDDDNIYAISGKLDGFSLGDKEFKGNGQVFGNAYIYGNIEKWNNAPLSMEVDIDGDNGIGYNETKTIKLKVKKGEQTVTSSATNWHVSRESGYTDADAEWEKDLTSGTLSITWADIPDLATKALFRFSATYEDDVVTTSVIIKKEAKGQGFVLGFEETDQLYDLARFRAPLTLTATYDGLDVLEQLTDDDVTWTRYTEVDGVERAGSDEIWNTLNKHRGKAIVLLKADLDIGSGSVPNYIKFTATATFNNVPASISFER